MNRLTDYAVVVLTRMAAEPSNRVHPAPELARDCGIPAPTVRKLLKTLARHDLVVGRRGPNGGYGLSRVPAEISVAQVMAAMEGSVGMTECSDRDGKRCDLESRCAVRSRWEAINQAISGVLEEVRLSDMARPAVASPLVLLHGNRRTS